MVKRVLVLLTGLIALAMMNNVTGQTRYLDDVFTSVDRMDTVVYAQNISILTLNNGDPDTLPLICDIYMPSGDTATDRPVVLIAPTGNFLPRLFNGGPYGTIKDSVVVELANRLAMKGYIAVPYYYRQGWDAANIDVVVQTQTLLQASYRGIQDARTLARYFRMTHDMQNNVYGINPDNISIIGTGTGGYMSLGAAFLNDFNEIDLPKFKDITTGDLLVNEPRDGDINGEVAAALNIPNHVGYSNAFKVAVNLGGALGDSTWVDQGEIPTICFHTNVDPFAPYELGNVIVPTTGNVVIPEAAGSYLVSKIQDRFGNNQVFKDAGFGSPVTGVANSRNNGWEGFFPFLFDVPTGALDCFGTPIDSVPASSPWNWYDEATFISNWDAGPFPTLFGAPGVAANCGELANDPGNDAAQARVYIDTVMAYMVPRIAVANGLVTATNLTDIINQELNMYPNPATNLITITNSDPMNPVYEVAILDQQGRMVYQRNMNERGTINIERGNLASGLYLVRIQTDKGRATKKLVLR
ncbi:MAG: T9SS type A sorting domain-containing protein [Bacteroidota bacterium]